MFIKFIFILLASTILTALITPLFRKMAAKNGMFDVPNIRKIHNDLTPRIGGIAIAIGFLAAVALGYELFSSDLRSLPLTGICIGGGIILYFGLIDDIRGLNAYQKFAGQTLAALTLIPFGFMIDSLNIPFIGVVHLGWSIGLPLTLLWIIGITNAINLIDGMDGLSSGVVAVASIVLFIVSILSGKLMMAIISIAVLGSALGFLWHNWNPATIFMGDCGAMFLGFTLAAVSIKISYMNTSGTYLFVPLLALSLPIIDTTLAIIRRISHGHSPFHADQGHIHHRLLHTGFTVRQTALMLYGVCAIFGITALVTTVVKSSIGFGITLGMLILSIVGLRILGRVEHKTVGDGAVGKRG